MLQCQGVLCSSSDIEKKKSTYVRILSQFHFDQSLTVMWPGNQKALTLVSWLFNLGIWQNMDVWGTLKCRGFFPSVWGVNGFLVSLPIRRSIWPIAGEFLHRSKSVAWFYGWKCVVCFSREPSRDQDGFLLSISFTSPHLPLPITHSIMLETAQDSTCSNRKRHCTSKWNNIVSQVLFLKNSHGWSKFPYKVLI